MKKKKENKITELTNFELGQIETCNFILDNVRKELQRLRSFDVEDILKLAEDPTYITKYLTTLKLNQFFYDNVANYKVKILKPGEDK